MNHNTSESAIVNSLSVTLENMKMELNNKIYAMIELAWEGINLVEQIKEDLGMCYDFEGSVLILYSRSFVCPEPRRVPTTNRWFILVV